tara:strand:- start:131 stop:403 length:273 start_codon:yes stop_codon:yes gene_type:complete
MFIKVLTLKINKMNPKIELKRFTTLIQPKLLSKIKLISYFTNQKLNEVVNKSLEEYIQKFELSSNTKIDSLIDFSSNFQTIDNKVKDKDK